MSCNLLQKIKYFIYLYLICVSVKEPIVTVDNYVARFNDVATLTCTIGIANDSPELVKPTVKWTPNNGNMSLSLLMDTNFFSSTYNVAVSSTSVAGDYNCSATIAAIMENTAILPSSGSSIGTLYVAGTSLYMYIMLVLALQLFSTFWISSFVTIILQCFNFLTDVLFS